MLKSHFEIDRLLTFVAVRIFNEGIAPPSDCSVIRGVKYRPLDSKDSHYTNSQVNADLMAISSKEIYLNTFLIKVPNLVGTSMRGFVVIKLSELHLYFSVVP